MNRAGALGLVFALLLAGCVSDNEKTDKNMEKDQYGEAAELVDDGTSPFKDVPLVTLTELVCAPDQYDGKEVRVQGIALSEPRDNNLYHDLFPKKVGTCGRLMIGMDYPSDFAKMASDYNRKRMEFVGTFSRNLCALDKYKYARVNDPKKPDKFICKSIELRSDAFLTNIHGWRLLPQ